jgi:hypothetical protein
VQSSPHSSSRRLQRSDPRSNHTRLCEPGFIALLTDRSDSGLTIGDERAALALRTIALLPLGTRS